MRSKTAQRILDRTPEETRIFVRKHADIVVRINQLLKAKGFTQKNLAEHMDKKPSEISKWLSGEHNFTLRSIAKLEAELGESIICIPQEKVYTNISNTTTTMTVVTNYPRRTNVSFQQTTYTLTNEKELANAS